MPVNDRREYEYREDQWLLYESEISRYVFNRMKDWIFDADRKPAGTAFTAGLTRTIAAMVEQAIRANESRSLHAPNR